jgi:V-type H+-transporting ATPase subunit C
MPFIKIPPPRSPGAVEGAVLKMRRALGDLGVAPEDVTVDDIPVHRFVVDFAWNEARFPSRRNLRETVDKVVDEVTKLEDDLKLQLVDFTAVKNALAQVTRKATGSLLVKDLHTLLEEHDVRHIETENLVAMYVVVPTFAEREFLESYVAFIETNLGSGSDRFSGIAPGSAEQVASDHDYALYRVVVFKRVSDDFRNAARQKGLQVREYKAPVVSNPELDGVGATPEALTQELRSKTVALREWLKDAYGEAFSGLFHLMMVRVFVESVLRYGVPPQYHAAVIQPREKTAAKVRAVLASDFGGESGDRWENTADDARAGMLSTEDIYPYVSYNVWL